jgi:hypothetical protein
MPADRANSGDNLRAMASKSPTALALVDAAALLTKLAGTPVTVVMLERDLEAGAPRNADGTLNLVHYAAWLAREAERAA